MKIRKPRIVITPYHIFSRSAKSIQEKLKTLVPTHRVIRVKKTSVKYHKRQSDFNIDWGKCSEVPWANADQEKAKAIARNKLKTFQKFKEHGISHPEWTTDVQTAVQWYFDNIPFVARKTLTGHSGEGIVMFDSKPEDYEKVTGDITVQCKAPLYVQYKKKKHEYRVHVFNNTVIDITQKKKKIGFENRDNQIRNYNNGWVYCRDNINEPTNLRQLALDACASISLSYGAVDIIWNELENKCYVLEINTAPGLVGTTLNKYSSKFMEMLNGN